MVKNFEDCITVYTQYRRVTDTQTDGQTSCHGIVRAMHTRGAVNKPGLLPLLHLIIDYVTNALHPVSQVSNNYVCSSIVVSSSN